MIWNTPRKQTENIAKFRTSNNIFFNKNIFPSNNIYISKHQHIPYIPHISVFMTKP